MTDTKKQESACYCGELLPGKTCLACQNAQLRGTLDANSAALAQAIIKYEGEIARLKELLNQAREYLPLVSSMTGDKKKKYRTFVPEVEAALQPSPGKGPK